MPKHDEIERRAYQLYEARGREDGHDWDDWFEAEREFVGAERRARQTGDAGRVNATTRKKPTAAAARAH